MFKWLRRLLGINQADIHHVAPPPSPAPPPATTSVNPVAPAVQHPPTSEPGLPNITSEAQAQEYLDRLHGKIAALAERFASGGINRAQFQELYKYYQREIQTIESILSIDSSSNEWKKAVTDGQSILIRARNKAIVIGLSIYENASGMPLKSLGHFALDPALFVPMLSAYRSATQEIFGAQLRSTQIEGGQWLCFVPGQITTTLVIFNMEPSGNQLQKLEDLQKLFEKANSHKLVHQPVDVEGLVCPQEFYVGRPL